MIDHQSIDDKNIKHKACILAAGIGSRVNHFSDIINKRVLPVNNNAVISYMMEKFPEDVAIITAK